MNDSKNVMTLLFIIDLVFCYSVVSVLAFKSGGGKHYLQLHFFTILTVSTSLHQTANNSLHAAHSSSGGCCMIQVSLWSLIAGVSVDRVRPSESWKVSSNNECKEVLGLDGWIFITQCCYWWTLPSSSSCSHIIMLAPSSSVTEGLSSYLQDLSTGWKDLFWWIKLTLISHLETRKL